MGKSIFRAPDFYRSLFGEYAEERKQGMIFIL